MADDTVMAERYRKALVMIESLRLNIGGIEVGDDRMSAWMRELAREALNGIDPNTGNPYDEE